VNSVDATDHLQNSSKDQQVYGNTVRSRATQSVKEVTVDWMLHPEAFELCHDVFLQKRGRKLAVDCAADAQGKNAHLPTFCNKESKNFLHCKGLEGKCLYANPPWRLIEQYCQRFLQLKSRDPQTEMMMITPKTPNRAWWSLMSKHFDQVHVFPYNWRSSQNEKLFSRPKQSVITNRIYKSSIAGREQCRSSPYDVVVWISKSSYNFVSSVKYREPKSHAHIADLHSFVAHVGGTKVSTLMDTGAQLNLINSKLVAQLKLPTHESDVTLKWLDKSVIKTRACVKDISVVVNGNEFTLSHAVVCDLATYDIIFGLPFLKQTEAEVKCGKGIITLLNSSADRVTLYQTTHVSKHDVPYIGVTKALKLLKNKKAELYVCHVRQVPTVMVHTTAVGNTATSATSVLDLKKAISPDCPKHVRTQLEKLLTEYADIFQPITTHPKPTEDDLDLKLKPGVKPFATVPYKLSEQEIEALQKIIQDWISRGWIRISSSNWAAPVLLIKKKNGKYRLVVDYRMLNEATLQECWPLPRIDQTLDRLVGCSLFSKMDLSNGYHQMAIKPTTMPLTGFVTPMGHYEWTVLPQGVKQAPSVFSKRVHKCLQHLYNKKFLSYYLDDLLTHTNPSQDHVLCLKQVFQAMRDNNLRADITKCEFGATAVTYLGHSVGVEGVGPEQSKLDAIHKWPVPDSVEAVHHFMGLLSWFRRFIPQFTQQSDLLQQIINTQEFVWTEAHTKQFETMKSLILNHITLPCFQTGADTAVWVDSSEYAVGGALFQRIGSTWKPVSFLSKKLQASQLGWHIQDKEFFAIICALETWGHYLRGASKPFVICTDHKSLIIKGTTKVRTQRLMRWHEKLLEYNYRLVHKAGCKNVVADLLSRRPDFKAFFPIPTEQTVVPVAETMTTSVSAFPAMLLSTFPSHLLDAIKSAHSSLMDVPTHLKLNAHGLYVTDHNHIYLPTLDLQHQVIHHVHSTHFHVGIHKTHSVLQRHFWFPYMKAVVHKALQGCTTCQQIKAVRRRKNTPASLARQVAMTGKRLSNIMIDFVWGLPQCNGKSGLLVVIDIFTKLVRAIPVTPNITSQQCADLLITHWISHYGIPTHIHSDQDIRFLSEMWKHILHQLNITHQMSSPYHPETQGVVERVNGFIVDCLRSALLDLNTSDWVSLVPWVCYALNSVTHLATGMTPHQLVFGTDFPILPASMSDSSMPDVFNTDKLNQLVEIARNKLLQVSLGQEELLGKQGPSFEPKPGDLVWLATAKLRLKAAAGTKLLPRYIGPFKVITAYPNAAKLVLPESMACRRTWHHKYLKPFVSNTTGMTGPAMDFELTHHDILEDEQYTLDEPEVVDVKQVTAIHFHSQTPHGTRFRVQFGNDWLDSEIVLEQELAALPNGLNVLQQWKAEQATRLRQR